MERDTLPIGRASSPAPQDRFTYQARQVPDGQWHDASKWHFDPQAAKADAERYQDCLKHHGIPLVCRVVRIDGDDLTPVGVEF